MSDNKLRFSNLPRFPRCPYSVFVSWESLERTIKEYQKWSLDLDPDFQRGYVWTPQQQTDYIEFILLGGSSGKDIYFNCPNWANSGTKDFVIVDGKQRLRAVMDFMADRVPIFGGHLRSEFEDYTDMLVARFEFHINDLTSRADVLRWYLALNTGGAVHTPTRLSA